MVRAPSTDAPVSCLRCPAPGKRERVQEPECRSSSPSRPASRSAWRPTSSSSASPRGPPSRRAPWATWPRPSAPRWPRRSSGRSSPARRTRSSRSRPAAATSSRRRVLLLGLGKPEALTDVDVRVFAAQGARFALGAKATSLAIELPSRRSARRRDRARHRRGRGARRLPLHQVPHRRPRAQDADRARHAGRRGQDRQGGARKAMALGQQSRRGHLHRARPHQRAAERALPRRCSPTAPSRSATSDGLEVTVLDKPALEKKGMKLILAVGAGQRPRAAPRPHDLQARRARREEEARLRRQGAHLRLRRPLHQARAGHGGDEGRHGRRRQRGRAHGRGRRASSPTSRCTASSAAPRTCPTAPPTGPATSSARYDGKTVEIINTDAEGRLVLADVLAYAPRAQARPHRSTTPPSPAPAWSRSGPRCPASTPTATRSPSG